MSGAVELPTWAAYVAAIGPAIGAFVGVLVAQLITRRGAKELEKRSRREQVMRTLQCKTPLHWAMAGGILAPLLVAVLAAVCRSAAHVPPEYDAATVYPLAAAQAIVEVGWWLTIPAGIATAYYLGRIQRVFAATAETTPSSSV